MVYMEKTVPSRRNPEKRLLLNLNQSNIKNSKQFSYYKRQDGFGSIKQLTLKQVSLYFPLIAVDARVLDDRHI